MDSITQIVLGASVGEAVAGKQMGNKAALWGAIAGTIPDLDVFMRFFYDPLDHALVHRGFSHSFVFALLVSPLLGFLLYKISRKNYDLKLWISLFFFSIVTHPLLDIFTNYGTQFFWPLENRLSTNSIFVIDPLYTLPFIVFLVLALRRKKDDPRRRKWNKIGLISSTSYLFIALFIKIAVLYKSETYFRNYNIDHDRTFVTPMPFTSFYWMIITEGENDYYIAYKSLFYSFNEKSIEVIPKNHEVLENLSDPLNKIQRMKTMSKGYYTCERNKNAVIIYDLRFGTSSRVTSPSNNKPVRGFGFVVDNETVNKTFSLSIKDRFNKLNFGVYWENIFNGSKNRRDDGASGD